MFNEQAYLNGYMEKNAGPVDSEGYALRPLNWYEFLRTKGIPEEVIKDLSDADVGKYKGSDYLAGLREHLNKTNYTPPEATAARNVHVGTEHPHYKIYQLQNEHVDFAKDPKTWVRVSGQPALSTKTLNAVRQNILNKTPLENVITEKGIPGVAPRGTSGVLAAEKYLSTTPKQLPVSTSRLGLIGMLGGLGVAGAQSAKDQILKNPEYDQLVSEKGLPALPRPNK